MDFAYRDSAELEGALRVARELAPAGAAGPEHLWAGVLCTAYGAGLLESFAVTLGQVTEKLGTGDGTGEWTDEAEQALAAARRVPLLTQGPLESLEADLVVEPSHLAYALVNSTPKPLERVMGGLGVVPTRLRWLVAGSNPRFPHPRDVGENRRMSWAAAASEEGRRLGWAVIGPELLLLGLLADPTNSACRALTAAGIDLRQLRHRLELPGPGSNVEDMEFSPEVLETLKRAAESWGDLDPDSAYTLQALLAASDVLGPEQAAVEAALPRVLHGSLVREQGVTIEGVGVGMTAAQVLEMHGEPMQRTQEEGQESWTYHELGVMVVADRVVGVHGAVLEQQGEPVLVQGDPWLKAEQVLGVRRQVSFAGDPPIKIWTLISSGRVGFLMLECLSHA